MKRQNAFLQTVTGLAFAASGFLIAPQSVSAQAPDPSVKKISLKQLVKENYGSKRNVPVAEILSLSDSVKPFNADRHIGLLREYKVARVAADNDFKVYASAKTGEKDTLHMGLSIWDKDNGYKGVFTYDAKNDVIDIHNAGLDNSNPGEWKDAAAAVLFHAIPASKYAIDYAEKGVDDLQRRFPQIKKGKTALRFTGYSMGGPVAMMGAFGMALEGHKIDQVMLIDPYAAIYTRHKIRHMVKGRENKELLNDFIEQRCMTMTPIGGSFVNRVLPFGLLGKDFGRIEQVDAGPKGEHHFLEHYFGKYTPCPPILKKP